MTDSPFTPTAGGGRGVAARPRTGLRDDVDASLRVSGGLQVVCASGAAGGSAGDGRG
jgi:hypothetical protein